MKSASTSCRALALAVALFALPGVAAGQDAVLPDDLLAAHWYPQTDTAARARTLAAAAWLDEPVTGTGDWQQAINVHTLALERAMESVPWSWAPPMDGAFAWLVHARDHNLAMSEWRLPPPRLAELDDLLQQPHAAGRLARDGWQAALEAAAIWRRVAQRLDSVEAVDATADLANFWAPLTGRLAADGADPDALAQAREQADRVRALAQIPEGESERRARLLADLVLAEADALWRGEQYLDAVWRVLEGLARAVMGDSAGIARAYADWLDARDESEIAGLRRVDVDLPVIMALLADAAGHLIRDDSTPAAAMDELGDVYARLVLFVPESGFYLDQPVRDDVRAVIADCNPDPLLVGPLPRDVYEQCLTGLLDFLETGLDSEELVGGSAGPFASEFLRRELSLASWQRAAYLDGHLAWLLEAPCSVPAWSNALEWSLLVEHLVRWVPQRPVFFTSPRWQGRLRELMEQSAARAEGRMEWVDCLVGQGSERRDPVLRLLDRQRQGLSELEVLLDEAGETFYQDVTRPGADITLDGDAGQVTAYRPETLMLGPCSRQRSCGARTPLPVSRALLGLFPNSYLLADQLGMGAVSLCYDRVRWVERESRPVRSQDSGVAVYQGRLSFELRGSFVEDGEAETVFRYRLTANEPQQYLFAADSREVLERDCPNELVGQSVASELDEDRPGLVPNRLTYFASAPVSAESLLLANWDRGAEWRDWFITGDRVEELERLDGSALQPAVQARLASLASERERRLGTDLARPPRADTDSPLAAVMARLTDEAALLRRVFEIHYPRVLRHDERIRSLLAGSHGLLTRQRVRTLRDEGVSVARLPEIGRRRLERLRARWLELPATLREQGHEPPEIDFAIERLEQLLEFTGAQRGGEAAGRQSSSR